jgi:hypothetical protein
VVQPVTRSTAADGCWFPLTKGTRITLSPVGVLRFQEPWRAIATPELQGAGKPVPWRKKRPSAAEWAWMPSVTRSIALQSAAVPVRLVS